MLFDVKDRERQRHCTKRTHTFAAKGSHQTFGYIIECVSVNLKTHDPSTLKNGYPDPVTILPFKNSIKRKMTATVMSRPPHRRTVPSLFLEKMEMLKEQANLEHDRGHSLCSICSLINGTRGITITYPPLPT